MTIKSLGSDVKKAIIHTLNQLANLIHTNDQNSSKTSLASMDEADQDRIVSEDDAMDTSAILSGKRDRAPVDRAPRRPEEAMPRG